MRRRVAAGALAVVAGVTGAVVARSAIAAPIIGGTATKLGDFPDVVAVAIGSASRFSLCTGELIEPNIVMTAAHCLSPAVVCAGASPTDPPTCTQDQLTAMTTVVSNTVNLNSSPGTSTGATATLGDPKFDPTHLGHNDLGLITLAQPITGVALALPNLHHGDAPNTITVTMVGFGATQEMAQGTLGEEFELQGKMAEPCAMLPALSGATASDDNLLCYSQTDGNGKCEGDSGGPSFAVINGKTKVVGTTSFGDTNCSMLGTDTRPDAEHRFLYSQIPNLECGSDGDCDGGRSCFSGQCVRLPGMSGSIGQGCSKDSECDTGECNAAPDGTDVCTIECSVGVASGCPASFNCEQVGSETSCFDGHAGGGCCDAGGQGGPAAVMLGVVLGVVVRRRRRAAQA